MKKPKTTKITSEDIRKLRRKVDWNLEIKSNREPPKVWLDHKDDLEIKNKRKQGKNLKTKDLELD